jgi:outer membrane protein TolC
MTRTTVSMVVGVLAACALTPIAAQTTVAPGAPPPAADSTPATTPATPPSTTPATTAAPGPASAAAPIVLRLTLAETVARAHLASPRLAQLRSLEGAAEAGSRGARAQGRPIIGLSAGYTRWSNVPDVSVPLAGGGTQVIYPNIPDNYQSRLGLSMPIYTGGRVSGLTAAAEHERSAAAHDVESGTSDTTLEAQSAY